MIYFYKNLDNSWTKCSCNLNHGRIFISEIDPSFIKFVYLLAHREPTIGISWVEFLDLYISTWRCVHSKSFTKGFFCSLIRHVIRQNFKGIAWNDRPKISCLYTDRCSVKYEELLTHWGRVTHICISELNMIGSHNGLSPGQHQAIVWNNAGILLIWL